MRGCRREPAAAESKPRAVGLASRNVGRWRSGRSFRVNRTGPRFARLILSRAGLTPARDKINPAKRGLCRSTLNLFSDGGRRLTSATSTAAPGCFRTSSAGEIRQPVSAGPEPCCQRCHHGRSSAARARCSPAAAPVRPLTPKLPLPESSWPAASGAVRSDDSTAVHGRLTAVKVCDGSASGGKTAQSDERPPGTTVPRCETGRHRLGTVPSGGGPS